MCTRKWKRIHLANTTYCILHACGCDSWNVLIAFLVLQMFILDPNGYCLLTQPCVHQQAYKTMTIMYNGNNLMSIKCIAMWQYTYFQGKGLKIWAPKPSPQCLHPWPWKRYLVQHPMSVWQWTHWAESYITAEINWLCFQTLGTEYLKTYELRSENAAEYSILGCYIE